jgi:hypothetical protein
MNVTERVMVQASFIDEGVTMPQGSVRVAGNATGCMHK